LPRYLVETISVFRMRYMIECDTAEEADDIVCSDNAGDGFGQKHIGETIVSTREITSDLETVELFIDDNGSEHLPHINKYIIYKETK
jgi:hypothetical protein